MQNIVGLSVGSFILIVHHFYLPQHIHIGKSRPYLKQVNINSFRSGKQKASRVRGDGVGFNEETIYSAPLFTFHNLENFDIVYRPYKTTKNETI